MSHPLLPLLLILATGLTTQAAPPLIGYTELQTNLPGGRHANVRTMRAMVVGVDGSGARRIAEELADNPDAWTQFAGWSPDGDQAIVLRGWQDPANAQWEEEHKTFRMLPGAWSLDCCLVEIATGQVTNLTASERVSHYNSGLFFMPQPDPSVPPRLGFTALIEGISKPFVMDLDGRHKQNLSGQDAGFAYGYSASPDGRLISYHENYQIYLANADGTAKRHIQTGHPFNFGPRWSPDGEWLLFVSGEHYDCHPYVVRRDGSGLKQVADRAGYRGVTEFLDVFDFHGGSSDTPVWSADGQSVFYTAKVDDNVELFQVALDGTATRLTTSPAGTSHYHPTPSQNGTQLLYGTLRHGARQLCIRDLTDGTEATITAYEPGRAALWPHWQPKPSRD